MRFRSVRIKSPATLKLLFRDIAKPAFPPARRLVLFQLHSMKSQSIFCQHAIERIESDLVRPDVRTALRERTAYCECDIVQYVMKNFIFCKQSKAAASTP